MVVKEDILEKFQITGCESLEDEILEKCIELCHWLEKDEEEFVDVWIAFAMEHLDGNLEPTLKTLEKMKRTISRNRNKDKNEALKKHEQSKLVTNVSDTWIDDENEILGIYTSSDTLSLMTKLARNPGDLEDSINADGCKTQPVECSQDSEFNVTATAPQSKVLMTFGSKISSWINMHVHKYTIRRAGPHVPSNARYMFELLKTTSEVRTRVCRIIGYHINSRWAVEKKDDVLVTWNVRTRSQNSYRTWGRVCFDSETKHSNPTVLLEGCRKPPRFHNADSKSWPQVELDLSDLRGCCLFPGQIVAVEGINLTENLLKVRDMYKGSFIPAAKSPQLTDDLKVMVAAGPFTQSNDLNYQPLWELMTKVVEEEPHILILIGPFLDYSHPNVQNNSFTCTFQEFFNKLIMRIKNYINGKCTQIVLVASSRDVHHHAVYPTPEYFLAKSIQSPEIHALPDPCILDIQGLRLGITSIDCLMHLGREEVTIKQSGMDKLSRLGSYILNQACFYPLYPPAKEVNIDSELWEKYAFMKEKPHMLLLPSDMRYFCKNINESVILNPERLSKRTFARINFKPSDGETWTQNNISCEIIKM